MHVGKCAAIHVPDASIFCIFWSKPALPCDTDTCVYLVLLQSWAPVSCDYGLVLKSSTAKCVQVSDVWLRKWWLDAFCLDRLQGDYAFRSFVETCGRKCRQSSSSKDPNPSQTALCNCFGLLYPAGAIDFCRNRRLPSPPLRLLQYLPGYMFFIRTHVSMCRQT